MRRTKIQATQTKMSLLNAARSVFLCDGVNGASLEKLAKTAQLTRGAIYWHFRNKAEIFEALLEEVLSPLIYKTSFLIDFESGRDPLESVRCFMDSLFMHLLQDRAILEVLKILTRKCEYTGVFTSIRLENYVFPSCLVMQIEMAYRAAAKAGILRSDADPKMAALDTRIFMVGLINYLTGYARDGVVLSEVSKLIDAHISHKRALA